MYFLHAKIIRRRRYRRRRKIARKTANFLNLIFDTYNIKIKIKILRILNFKYLNFNM
jgi:hypothetical protein